MMQVHELKISWRYADAVLSGDKPFEIRYNDRGFQKGDEVLFTVVNDYKIRTYHPLDNVRFEITYLLHGYGLEKDWCVFGIRQLED